MNRIWIVETKGLKWSERYRVYGVFRDKGIAMGFMDGIMGKNKRLRPYVPGKKVRKA